MIKIKYETQKTKYFGKNNPHYKKGKPYCVICNKKISYSHTYCKQHIPGHKITLSARKKIGKANRGEKNGRYRIGFYLKNKKCINCGKHCSSGAIRCKSCNEKINKLGEKNPNYGKGNLMLGINNPNYKHGKTNNIFCIKCGKKLKGIYAKRCRKCWKVYYKKYYSGKRNILYIHGLCYEPYSSKFKNSLKKFIRRRDKYECQLCRIEQKNYRRKLDIHHIDYNKYNCNKNNLITLCNNCNTIVNFNRDYWYAYFIYLIEENKIKF